MKTILSIAGAIFVILGIAVGGASQLDRGNVLIDLNLGVAATLLVGGFIILGLSGVIGALQNMGLPAAKPKQKKSSAREAVHDTPNDGPRPPKFETAKVGAIGGAVGAAAGVAAASVGNQLDKAGKGVDSAIDKVAEVASEAKAVAKEAASEVKDTAADAVKATTQVAGSATDAVAEKANAATDSVEDMFANAKDAAKEKTADAVNAVSETTNDLVDGAKDVAGDAANAVTDTAKDAVDTVAGTAENAKDAVAEVVDDAVAATDVEELSEEDAAVAVDPEDPDQLYVVEELIIRERPARVLSDNTVEAETDEGWMRFENVEHLEEYLDAMKG